MIDLYERGKQKFNWWPDWRGECVAIIGAGPSAQQAEIEKLRDRIHVIAINESYRLCPWADILYSCDAAWWNLREREINGFAGLKILFEHPRQFILRAPDLKQIKVAKHPKARDEYLHDYLFDEPGVVGSGGHSGFQMINLAAQFGVTGIALVAFDMQPGGNLHWHGRHPSPLRNPDESRFKEWRTIMDKTAPQLRMAGLDVVNCSQISTITAFEKLTIAETLQRWGL